MKQSLKKEIVEHLLDFMKTHGLSASEVSKKTHINASYLSQILNGKYVIVVKDKEVEIADKYFKQLAEFCNYDLSDHIWQVRPTLQLQRMLATLEEAKKYGYTNTIIGDTGSGKSFGLNLFAKKHPIDCFVITVGSTDRISDLVDKIIQATGADYKKTQSRKIQSIIRKLIKLNHSGYKPMIVFDEAEYMKGAALCNVKELYDHLHGVCSIVLIGTRQLIDNIDSLRKRNRCGIPQLYRRIKFGIRYLAPIDKTYSQFLEGYNSKVRNFIAKHCENYGELHDLLVPAMREAERAGKPLDIDFIKTMLGYN